MITKRLLDIFITHTKKICNRAYLNGILLGYIGMIIPKYNFVMRIFRNHKINYSAAIKICKSKLTKQFENLLSL